MLAVCVYASADRMKEPTDPPGGLLRDLRRILPKYQWCKYSEIQWKDGTVIHTKSGKPAWYCWVTIRWITDTKVEVDKGFMGGSLYGGGTTYEMIKKDGKWEDAGAVKQYWVS